MKTGLLAALLLAAAAPAWAVGPNVIRQTLSNGALVQIAEQPAVPMVIVDALIDAGSRFDPPGQEGLANLTADLLTEGAGKRNAEQIHEVVDFLGASLNSEATADFAYLNMKMLRKDFEAGLDLWTDSLLRPTFDKKEVDRRKTAILASIRASEDNPGIVADRAFDKALFGAAPYGHPTDGWSETVGKLNRQEVVDFYQRWFRPSRTIITVVGDVKAAEIIAALEEKLKGWRDNGTPPLVAPVPPPDPSPLTIAIDKPLTQANIILGHRGVPRNNPDWPALTVMNYILGGGSFSSRLFDTVRTKGGLAYSVNSSFNGSKDDGSFKVTMQTKAASAPEAIAKAREEIERIRTTPVSDVELQEAKQYLTGSFPMRFDANTKITGLLAQIEFYGLGHDYLDTFVERINGVTAEDVQRVAQKQLRPEEFILVLVGPTADAGATK